MVQQTQTRETRSTTSISLVPRTLAPDRALFSTEGEYWILKYAGTISRLKNTQGLTHLAQLLRAPGTKFHVLDLVGYSATCIDVGEDAGATVRAVGQDRGTAGLHGNKLDDAGEWLDEQAKATYRHRLSELREGLEEAKRRGRIARAEELEEELEALVAELSRATGQGGRSRRAGAAFLASERARQSVTRAIHGALRRIAAHQPALGQHLARCIRVGTYCCYAPDPHCPLVWDFAVESGESALAARHEGSTGNGPTQSQALSTPGRGMVSGPSKLRQHQTDFVCRQHEIDILRSALDRAHGGAGAVAMLSGGPGVGKTRLALEMAHYATGQGFRVFAGGCSESDEPFPYLPFAEILEAMLEQSSSTEEFRRELGDNVAELAQIAPRLRHVFPDLPLPMKLPAPPMRRYLFQSVAEFLSSAARRAPLLLVLDDLQWADEATLALLNFLADQYEPMQLVILGIYRDTELKTNPALVRTLEELIRHGLRPIKLHGLSQDCTGQMLRCLSLREPPLQLVHLVFEATQGNPFFVEELYKHLVEENKLFDPTGEFRTELTLDESDIPDNIRLVLGRRLQRLSDKARQVLIAAAVIGRNFNFKLLAAVLDSIDVDDVLAAIEQAQGMGLIIDSDSPESPLTFAHEMVRQTLLAQISLPRRQRWQLAVAEAIEQIGAGRRNERAAELADHLRWGSVALGT